MVCNRVREYRKKIGWTQEKLASVANISRVHLSNIENMKDMPSIDVVERISQALNESKDTLFFARNVHYNEQNQ